MTDNDIIKALNICVKDGSCKECPINPNHGNYGYCTNLALTHALDLINRQKAKNEALQMDNDQLHSDIVNLTQSFDHVKGLWEAEKKKVVEAKQKVIDLCKKLKTTKSEVRSECAEGIFEKIFYFINLYKKGHFSEKALFKYIAEIEKEYMENET